MGEIIGSDDSMHSDDVGPNLLRQLAEEMGITYEEAVQRGTDFLIEAALHAKLEGHSLTPGHAELLRRAASVDASIASRADEILSAMYRKPTEGE